MSDITTLMMGAAGQVGGDYQISRSLRFNSADSAYLSRTPASAGNRKTWTWSGWVKLAKEKTNGLFRASNDQLRFEGNYFTVYLNNVTGGYAQTAAIFRDYSAWYHVVVAVDTTQATTSDRIKIYVNGQLQTIGSSSFGSSKPIQNYDTAINTAIEHDIGLAGGVYADQYLTEVHFIDGQALTADDFGETDETTGVWKPKRFSGPWNVGTGVNGFYLPFSDNSSTTALGYDAAGSNDWTPNNFSVTAGAGNDSLVDTPTQYGTDTGAGGEVRGNYCTLNPLFKSKDGGTTSNGNLNYAATRAAWDIVCGSIGMTSGKWYWEVSANQSTYCKAGITSSSVTLESNYFNSGDTYGYDADLGTKYSGNIGANQTYGDSWNGLNDICGVAFDADNMELTFYKNGVSQGVAYTTANFPTDGRAFFPAVSCYDTSTATFNFGQRPFAYTAPSGFKALVTTNLPDPTVLQGDDHFNTVTYSGNSSTNAITGVGFQPDLLWMKSRSNTTSHYLTDAVRGFGKTVFSDLTNAEADYGSQFVATSDGFTLGNNSGVNNSLHTYVAWNWKANGAGVSNTAGTITSTVSANTTAGISIVTWNSGSAGNITVGHGLGVAPSMVIMKVRTAVGGWYVWITGFSGSQFLGLNDTSAVGTDSRLWANAVPTSTVFSLESGYYPAANQDMVAYCFAEVEGFSKFGSYTGNGSADGPFVYTGFRPSLVLYKASSTTSSWFLNDNQRDGYNFANKDLYPNESSAESAGGFIDILSNGFKLRTTSARNTNGATYIFMAFAEVPFRNSLAR